jgi:Na+-driven multidrug efflux pump
MGVSNTQVSKLLKVMLFFYVVFCFNCLFDGYFYGIGKTVYMTIQSFITNVLVYVSAFILYSLKIWIPDLESTALLFGLGILVDSLISAVFYFWVCSNNKDKEISLVKVS